MNDERMNEEARRLFVEEEARRLAVLVELINRWPGLTRHFVLGLLGSAVGACDTFGIDAEQVLRDLRAAQRLGVVPK